MILQFEIEIHFSIAHPYARSRPVSRPTTTMDGATHKEQLLEAARRNNTELLAQIVEETGADNVAALINATSEVISGNTPLHIATHAGNWEFIDMVLDIEGVELDPRNRDGDTPLHLAVKYAGDEPEHGFHIIDNLIDAGSDVRAVDNHGLKPVNYVRDDPKLCGLLESAEYATAAPAEVVESDSDGPSDSDDE